MKIKKYTHCSSIDECMFFFIKDVPGGFSKSDLLGVTVALTHVAAQRFLAVCEIHNVRV